MAYQHEWEKGDLLRIAQGKVNGFSLVHKFGHATINTDIVPVCYGTAWQTPTTPQVLTAKSTNAGDTSAGTGGQQIYVQYLNSAYVYQTAYLEMAGTAETAGTISDVLRVVRAYVSRSGSYASAVKASHFGNISLIGSNAGVLWSLIPTLASSFGAGQSLIGAYTVPKGHTAFILNQFVTVDANKSTDFYFFKRENINDITTPFSGTMRVQSLEVGVKEPIDKKHSTAELYPEYTDIGYMAKGAQSGDCAVEFELILVDNNYL